LHSKPLVGQACSLDVGERMAQALFGHGGEAKNTDGGRPLARAAAVETSPSFAPTTNLTNVRGW